MWTIDQAREKKSIFSNVESSGEFLSPAQVDGEWRMGYNNESYLLYDEQEVAIHTKIQKL